MAPLICTAGEKKQSPRQGWQLPSPQKQSRWSLRHAADSTADLQFDLPTG